LVAVPILAFKENNLIHGQIINISGGE